MNLQLDAAALREVTTQAVLGILSPEVKTKLVQEAIMAILKPSTDSWNRGKSPLEQAFEVALTDVSRKIVREMVEQDETIKTAVRDMIQKTALKIFSCDVDKMAERMADAFTNSMRKD